MVTASLAPVEIDRIAGDGNAEVRAEEQSWLIENRLATKDDVALLEKSMAPPVWKHWSFD
ncbi:hypothetical protein CCP1ISM_1320003 [Azospirillaceae bacterium]